MKTMTTRTCFLIAAGWLSLLGSQQTLLAKEAKQEAHETVNQWGDFPTGRTIEFSGYTWRVKGSTPDVRYGPGGFPFGADERTVWVDDRGRLHLKVSQIDGVWHSAEVRLTEYLGHGDYRFTTAGRVDELDLNLTFGLFIWEYVARFRERSRHENAASEFDIEFGRWKDPERFPMQFVCQPFQPEGNLWAYDLKLTDDADVCTHAFRWLPDRVECRGWLGGLDAESDPEAQLADWTYRGRDNPKGKPQVHINLWCNGEPPARGEPVEVIVERFEFLPAED